MTTRIVEGKQPYTGGTAIEIDENKVISLRLRDENNLIIYDAGDNEIYVDLQLPDEITPTDAFPVGITTGRVIVDNGWDLQGTLICAKTTSGDNIKLLYADEGTLWIDNGTGTFKQIYFKADVDTIITNLTSYINGELAKKQNGVTSATAPTDPAEGDLWYDTTHNTLKVYNGSSWVTTGGGGGSGDVIVSTDTGNELTTGVGLWFGTETDYSSISTPDTNTLYIQYKSEGGGWQPGADTIAYFPLNSDLLDHSGNSFSVTTYGNVSIGTAGGVSAGDFSSIGELSGSVVTTGSLTVLGYAYKTANPNNDNASIFGFAGGGSMGGPLCQALYWNTNGDYHISNKPGVALFDWDTQANQTAVSMNNNEWVHFAVTYDWDTKVVKLYTNGVLSSQYTSSVTSHPDYLGMSRADGIDRSWIGYLSEVIFEDKCWTATEISNYFNATKSTYGIS